MLNSRTGHAVSIADRAALDKAAERTVKQGPTCACGGGKTTVFDHCARCLTRVKHHDTTALNRDEQK